MSATLGTGLCGALTTSSTSGYEAFTLLGKGLHATALRYDVGSATAALLVAAVGWWAARGMVN